MSRHLNNKLDPEVEAHGKEVAQRIQAVRRVRQQVLAGMHPACPQDGHPSAYIGLIGAFGTARLMFVCSRGDRFT